MHCLYPACTPFFGGGDLSLFVTITSMEKIYINPRIMQAMRLSENEKAVWNVLLGQQTGKTPGRIARLAGIPRTTAVYILKKFHKYGLVLREVGVLGHKCPIWRYKKGLEFMHFKTKNDKVPREIRFDNEC